MDCRVGIVKGEIIINLWNIVFIYDLSLGRVKSESEKTGYRFFMQSPRFKKIGSKLSLGPIYDLSFRIQPASYFPQS